MKVLFKAFGGKNCFETITQKMKLANHVCSGNGGPTQFQIRTLFTMRKNGEVFQ